MSQPKRTDAKRGVLLFNLGGPESLKDVRPFLYNLFSDPDIIRIKNDTARKLLAFFIATTRQYKSRGLYRQIGGGSPLRKITDQQAAALESKLEACGADARVYVGMRCWKPTIDEAVERIRADRITHLVVLPLFPQYSVTTTGSCVRYFRSLVDRLGLAATTEISYIDNWFEESLYLEALSDRIWDALNEFHDPDPEKIHLLYSAHSIPARYVEEGDPYLEQTRRTVALINSRMGHASPWTLAFQSKVGPVKWLEPATKDVIVKLAAAGKDQVLAVPVSFVSDHIETLQEIDILYKDLATKSGIKEFRRAESLNLHPTFIDALVEIASAAFLKSGSS